MQLNCRFCQTKPSLEVPPEKRFAKVERFEQIDSDRRRFRPLLYVAATIFFAFASACGEQPSRSSQHGGQPNMRKSDARDVQISIPNEELFGLVHAQRSFRELGIEKIEALRSLKSVFSELPAAEIENAYPLLEMAASKMIDCPMIAEDALTGAWLENSTRFNFMDGNPDPARIKSYSLAIKYRCKGALIETPVVLNGFSAQVQKPYVLESIEGEKPAEGTLWVAVKASFLNQSDQQVAFDPKIELMDRVAKTRYAASQNLTYAEEIAGGMFGLESEYIAPGLIKEKIAVFEVASKLYEARGPGWTIIISINGEERGFLYNHYTLKQMNEQRKQ